MIPNLGDFKEDSTVYIMFNTFSSNDPSASCTITNFANTDVHIHKDDGLAQRNNAAGITVSIDFDGITGSHMIKIDTNDNTVAGFWVTGKDYFVRVEGTTIDGATINAVIGRFSIENRFNEVDVVKWLGQACVAVTVNGVPKVDITHLLGTAWLAPGVAGTPDVNAKQLGGTAQTGRDVGSNVLLSSGSGAGQLDFTSGVVKSNLAQILGTALTETAGWLAAGFKKLFNVATPVLVASDVMRGTDGANTTVPDAAGVAATPAEVATALTDINLDHLCKTATAGADMTTEVVDNTILSRILSNGDTSVFDPSTDGLQLIRDRGDSAWTTGAGGSDRLLMVDTTIATLASQTSFTLTSGSADDDAYNNCTIVIEDVSTATQKAVGVISDYTGGTKTVTLKYDPAIFTMATTDKVYILAENALKSTLANRQLNVAADGDIAGNVDGSVASVVGHTAQTGDSYAVVNHADHGNAQLVRSTTPANKLDVSATGEAGLDFDNIKDATGAHTLTNITVPVCTSNTDMRGTDSAALATGVQLSAQGKLDVNAECDTALTDYDAPTKAEQDSAFTEIKGATWAAGTDTLEHIRDKETDIETDTAGLSGDAMRGTDGANTTVPDAAGVAPTAAEIKTEVEQAGSSIAQILTDTNELQTNQGSWITAAGFSVPNEYDTVLSDIKGATFNTATDSLEAIRDRGDAAWVTGGGGSISDILNVQPLIPDAIDLADTATVRISLGLTNMLDDLPSTAEIVPGTITIDRKAIGGTSWLNVVNAAACSELAGLIYYDEVFDAGTGYVAGDTIRVTFKSQKINVAANDYEITGTDGWAFHTYIREAMRGTDSAYTGTPPTAVAIADQVWDEAASGHLSAGSFGELLALTAGLAQQNQYLDQTVYTATGYLSSGRLRLYNNAGSVGTSSNVLATYLITSNWSGNALSSYKVVKQ